MTTYTAHATRCEGWWAVEVVEVPGLFTQAKRLDQIPEMVRDALELFPELEPAPANAQVIVVPEERFAALSQEVSDLRSQASLAQSAASEASQKAARQLSADGLSYRDIGTLLGVSFQRAQALVTH